MYFYNSKWLDTLERTDFKVLRVLFSILDKYQEVIDRIDQ